MPARFASRSPASTREAAKSASARPGSSSTSSPPRRKRRLSRLFRLGGEDVEDEPGRALADFAASLVDAGERDANLAGIVQIAAADDRQVFGHGDSLSECFSDHPHSDDIVVAKYPI